MMRRWLFWLLIIGVVWAGVHRFAEIENLVATLVLGQWEWVLAAALLQLLYYLLYAALYRSAFSTVEIESRVSELLPVWFASIFVNVAAPGSGPALFVDDAARRGQSAARAAAGTALVRVADFLTFSLVLAVGLVFLLLHHDLHAYELVGVALLMGITGAWIGVLLLGLWQTERLRRLLGGLQRMVNRSAGWLRRPPFLADDWAEKNAAEFTEAALAIAAHPERLGRTLAVALVAHMVDVASLYTLFLAFHQPVGLGTLISGFGIGVLFWIVSITPEGIGVVEGVMTLVYHSLGVPASKALVITLAFRGLTFWLPLALGFALLRRVKAFGAAERSRAEVGSVRAVALLTGFLGVVNVVSAIMPALPQRLSLLAQWSPLEVRHGSHLAAAPAGFALLVLAGSLWRRKRMAWLLTLAVLTLSVISLLLKGLDYEEAILGAVLAVWLFTLRPHFHARSDPPSVRQGVGVLLGALVFTLVYGVTGFYLLDRQYSVNFDFSAALRQTIVMFTQFEDPGLQPLTPFGRYFADSIYGVAAGTMGYALFMLVRPVLIRHPATPAERARARAIVETHGRSSLARFTLFDDKSYYFSPGGSVVAYAVKGGIAVALGDPIGPVEDAAGAIVGFRNHCARNDWQAAFYQTLPDYLGQYREAGFHTLRIGHEAIVDLGRFTLEGKTGKPLRAAANRLTRLGHRPVMHPPPLPDPLLRELRTISDEWLTLVHGTEKRFSLGWFDDDYIRASPVMAIHTPEGPISAFANVVPEYQLNESTIDLMRHRREAERGTMDFLFVSLFQWAAEQGYATFNLGLSPLAGVGEGARDPLAERAIHYIHEHLNQFYSFKGLHAFKAKFGPEWSPRYLVYPGPAALPAVVIAILRADASGPSSPL